MSQGEYFKSCISTAKIILQLSKPDYCKGIYKSRISLADWAKGRFLLYKPTHEYVNQSPSSRRSFQTLRILSDVIIMTVKPAAKIDPDSRPQRCNRGTDKEKENKSGSENNIR